MPEGLGLTLPQISEQRRLFLRRANELGAPPDEAKAAVDRLERRLSNWTGGLPEGRSARFKDKIPRGAEAECSVGTDAAEALIVRVLSMTRGDGQFTVERSGAVFSTEASGWTIEKARVLVNGLSDLLDDAVMIFRQMRPGGGRMFFLGDDSFINAKTRRRFLQARFDGSGITIDLIPGSETGVVSAAVCPGCFVELPANGRCDRCE